MVRPIRRLRAVPLIAESIVHHLSPFALQFSDGVGIRWYGLSYAMGFLVAWMVLRWLAREYGVPFARLDELEPDKQVLSLFPARLLLRDELLPLRRVDNQIEIATSRLFATQGLDGLKALTGLRLRPVLAPTEVIQREMKKRLGVGADTIDTLDDDDDVQTVWGNYEISDEVMEKLG